MFTVIYSFKVKKEREADFIKAWRNLTKLIYDYEGSLGSRLHKQKDHAYIAYAQWPDRATWENAGNKMPDFSKEISHNMKDACEKIETIYKLDVIDDLLKKELKAAPDRP